MLSSPRVGEQRAEAAFAESAGGLRLQNRKTRATGDGASATDAPSIPS